jgi:hypothetical protein
MVHCTAAGPEPPVLASETFTLNALPGAVLPEPKDNATCWAMAWLVVISRTIQADLKMNLWVEFRDE